ncbi:MAG: T9SS type A sorting domain-containing protein, partial [Bacteroidetes bacterium]|nr:T9SS type A sorting domain-containing protein [Bacteroidota bacterium]
YEFKSVMGTFNGRFTLLFEEENILSSPDTILESISIYPNPTQNILTIVSPQVVVRNVEVYDLGGRKVVSVDFNDQGNYQVDMSKLETALYFVKINTDRGSITRRVIKN